MDSKPAISGQSPVRILIVDDHPNTANMLARAVSQLGRNAEVISASSGREALERVQSGAVDILITDMIMPEMNGLELAEKLQTHPAGRPSYVILITAYDVPGLKETAQRAKVDAIIVKPVRPERICQIVEKLLDEWQPARLPEKEVEAKNSKFKILVADDRPDNVILLARYLESEGYDYVTASDGVEALDQLRARLPDLLLLDINMPKKDGFVVLEEMRADPALQGIPVIILTAARLDPTDIQAGFNLGADDYVTKPFDRRELMGRIRAKLRVKESGDQLLRRNRELSMLLEVTGILNSRGHPGTMLNSAMELIVKRLGAGTGHIFNFETETRISFPASSTVIDIRLLKEFLGANHKTDFARIIGNAGEDALWREQVGGTALSTLLVAMPDRHGGLLGAMLLTHEESAYFQPEQIPVLQAIANQIVVTIENAAWYEILQDKRMSLGSSSA